MIQRRVNAAARFRLADFLFRSERSAPIWLVVRLWIAWQWLYAGWEKVSGHGTANWLTHPDQLRGFINGVNYAWEHQALTHGHPQVPYKWVMDTYDGLWGNALFVSRVDTIAELAVGVGLMLGCLTGVAAAGGVLLNFMYIAGGSAGTNGIMMILGIVLMLAWRVAGGGVLWHRPHPARHATTVQSIRAVSPWKAPQAGGSGVEFGWLTTDGVPVVAAAEAWGLRTVRSPRS